MRGKGKGRGCSLSDHRPLPDRLLDGAVWIGTVEHAQDSEALERCGITAVLSLVPLASCPVKAHTTIACEDDAGFNMAPVLQQAVSARASTCTH